MANQLVQYGAVVAGAATISAGITGITAAAGAYNTATTAISRSAFSGVDGAITAGAAQTAADAGTAAFTSSMTSTFTNPAFLTSVGMGVAGILLAKKTTIPSLKLPNLMATAAVALSVGSLLKQGQAALEAANRGPGGGTLVSPINFSTSSVSDVALSTHEKRQWGENALLRYPLNANETYWMKFKLRKYSRKASGNVNEPGNFHTEIKMPLPVALVDAIKLNYQDIALGIFGGVAVDTASAAYDEYQASKAAGGTTAKNLGAGGKPIVQSMSDFLKHKDNLYAIGRRAVQGSQFLSAAADMVTGTAPNPHMAVTFQGVALKRHTFTWRLSPDSLDESKELEQIILNLQAASLPSIEDTMGLFLTFPSIAVVEMNPSLMEFKPCAIDSVVVNYAPNGVPSFFRPETIGSDKRYPTEIELTITLRELDIHTADMEQYRSTKLEQAAAITAPTSRDERDAALLAQYAPPN